MTSDSYDPRTILRGSYAKDIATIGLIQVDMGRRQDVLLDQLEAVLELRIAIEQAKGMVAQIRGITPPEAFVLMRGYATEHHHRLTELVHAVIQRSPMVAGLLTPPPPLSAPT